MPAAEHCWTKNVRTFAHGVANSATFQAMTETSDADAAKKFVFGDMLDISLDGEAWSDNDLKELRHYAQVYPTTIGMRRQGSSAFVPAGDAVIILERLVPELDVNDTPSSEVWEDWRNTIGQVVGETIDWVEANGGPCVNEWNIVEGPGWNDDKDWGTQGAWQGVQLVIEWGIPR